MFISTLFNYVSSFPLRKTLPLCHHGLLLSPSLIFPALGESSLRSITFHTVKSGSISLKIPTHAMQRTQIKKSPPVQSHEKSPVCYLLHTQTVYFQRKHKYTNWYTGHSFCWSRSPEQTESWDHMRALHLKIQSPNSYPIYSQGHFSVSNYHSTVLQIHMSHLDMCTVQKRCTWSFFLTKLKTHL